MKLYTNHFSPNCRKVHAVAAHAGIDLDLVSLSLQDGDQRKSDFLALNPNGKVPVLVDRDTVLWESNAICCYVAGSADSDLWPKSDQRYDIMQWCFWEANHWSQAIVMILVQKFFNADNPDQAMIDRGLEDFRKYAAVLNSHIAGRDFMSGDGPTIADFAIAVWLGYTGPLGLPTMDFANIVSWNQRLIQLPAWREMLPPKR